MSVEYWYLEDNFSLVQQSLHRSIGQLAGTADYIKIGRTNDPERRWREHQAERREYKDAWRRMVVIYCTETVHEAALAEKELMKYARRRSVKCDYTVFNFRAGDDLPPAETQYVYVLVDAHGDPQKKPIWYYSTGRFNEVLVGLKQAVAAYARQAEHIKIGRTNDPLRRWREHRAETDWQRMVVIYASSSFKSVATTEKLLIDHAIASGYEAKVVNAVGGSDNARPATNYVYVLLD